MLIYLQSLLLCQTAILLTLILTLCFRSSLLLPIQTANLATLPSLTARPVPILSQNVMPVFITSVITSTPHKTNNASQIKRAPSSNPGYNYGIHRRKLFLQYRENWTIQYSIQWWWTQPCEISSFKYRDLSPSQERDDTENYLSSILGELNPSIKQTWPCSCDTDFSTSQWSETSHIKDLYLQHRDICVAGKTVQVLSKTWININGNKMINNFKTRIHFTAVVPAAPPHLII